MCSSYNIHCTLLRGGLLASNREAEYIIFITPLCMVQETSAMCTGLVITLISITYIFSGNQILLTEGAGHGAFFTHPIMGLFMDRFQIGITHAQWFTYTICVK